jgi:hypothetical protein
LTKILRILAYLFHAVLSVLLLGIGIVAFADGTHNLNLPMFPGKGEQVSWIVLIGGIAGLLSVLLAATGRFRPLFTLWAVYVAGTAIYWMFFSPRASFSGSSGFKQALAFLGAAVVAALASFTGYRRRGNS